MTADDDERDRRAGPDWEVPRWRQEAEGQGDVERSRRFRNQGAPPQRGAIDDDGSVAGGDGTSDHGHEPEATDEVTEPE